MDKKNLLLMVKKSFFLLVLSLLLILGGCTNSSDSSAGMIIPPSGQVSPFGGKWTVIQELETNEDAEHTVQQWAGSDVQFAEGAVAFGGNVWNNLSYKIKRVNAADYLTTKYITHSDISIAKTQDVDVITVYAAANFLGEFMKIDDTNMIFFVQNENLILKKVSDQADSMPGAANTNPQDLNHDNNEGTSGILLGLRIPSGAGYSYRTLWIAADHKQLHPVLAAEQLFFPRTSGFWEISEQDSSVGGKTGNLLTARNVAAKTLGKNEEKETDDQVITDSTTSVIDYIGNDYVAIEKNTAGVNRLQVLPVDKLLSSTGIKISDLLGDKGSSVYFSARENAAEGLREKGIASIDKDESAENFGLARENGHWFLIGRINYQSNGTFAQKDFDLKSIPPTNLIFYDTLALSWHNIKDRVPDAMDAFTSPNKDIALVKTKNKLTVYPISTERLAENSLAELDLQEGTTVIMAEWATGSYVESWEKSFLSYGGQALSGSAIWLR